MEDTNFNLGPNRAKIQTHKIFDETMFEGTFDECREWLINHNAIEFRIPNEVRYRIGNRIYFCTAISGMYQGHNVGFNINQK